MIDTAQPQVKSIENSSSYGKFEIEPLEPGFGTTLGNAPTSSRRFRTSKKT